MEVLSRKPVPAHTHSSQGNQNQGCAVIPLISRNHVYLQSVWSNRTFIRFPLLKKNPRRDDQAQMITSCILLIVYILNLQYDILHREKASS